MAMPRWFRILSTAVTPKRLAARHQPSGLSGAAGHCTDGIDTYLQQTTALIRTVREGLGVAADDAVIQGNSAFYLRAGGGNRATGAKAAVLMAHGLTDSPFVTRDLGAFFQRRGFNVLSILLPGHGTCPGDLLEVSWRDWQQALADAVQTLADRHETVYLCGFSLGAALALKQALTDERVSALFLFSPALQLPAAAFVISALHVLSRWIPHLRWFDVQPDDDPYKYESIPANAIHQTWRLVQQLQRLLSLRDVQIPVFLATSDDDASVEPAASVDFFRRLGSRHKRLLFYSRRQPAGLPAESRVIHSVLPEKKVISSSHMAMIVAPDNPHYGEQGQYAFCHHYYRADAEKYTRCKQFREDCLGEITLQTGPRQVLRRLTWNPWYDELLQELDRFIDTLS